MLSSVDADGDESVQSEMVSAGLAVPDTAVAVDVTGGSGGGSGGSVVPAPDTAAAVDVNGGSGGGGGGCFILTAAESGPVEGSWMLTVLAGILGIGLVGARRGKKKLIADSS